jgi:hypothetical protein
MITLKLSSDSMVLTMDRYTRLLMFMMDLEMEGAFVMLMLRSSRINFIPP